MIGQDKYKLFFTNHFSDRKYERLGEEMSFDDLMNSLNYSKVIQEVPFGTTRERVPVNALKLLCKTPYARNKFHVVVLTHNGFMEFTAITIYRANFRNIKEEKFPLSALNINMIEEMVDCGFCNITREEL